MMADSPERGAPIRPADLSRRVPGEESIKRAHLLTLGAVVLLAVLLRLPFVTQPLVDAFSWRQASTAMMADNFRTGGWNIFLPEVSWTGPGPSYQGREFQLLSYITAILHAVFGWHDWFGRLVAMLFGLVTLVSLHRLAALIWDEPHAHAVAGAYAVMPAAIAIDTSFLPDPSMLAMLTLGLWLFVRYWRGGPPALLILGAAAFTLGVLCKLPGLSAGLAVVWLVGAALLRGEKKIAGLSALASAVGLALVVAYYAWAIHLGTTTPPYHVAGSGYLWDDGLSAFFAEAFYTEKAGWIATNWFYGWPLLLLMLVGLWFWPSAAELRQDPALTLLPLVWLGGAVVVYLVGAREITANPWNLHMFHVPMAFLIGRAVVVLVGLGGVALGRRMARVAILGAVVLIGSLSPLLESIKTPYAEAGQQLGEALAGLRRPDDLAILVAPTVGDPIALYYSRGRGWVFPPGGDDRDWARLYDDDATAIAELERLRAEGARWFGLTRNATDNQGRLFVEHHASVVEHLMQTGELVSFDDAHLLWRLDQPG